MSKLNGSQRDDLTTGIGNLLSNLNINGTNSIKNEIKQILKETKSGDKYLHKGISEKLIKELSKVVPESVKGDVSDYIAKFKKVIDSAPSRLISGYIKFATKLRKSDPKLAGLGIADASKIITEAWNKLSDAEKAKFNPSDKELKDYEAAKNKFADELKKIKEGTVSQKSKVSSVAKSDNASKQKTPTKSKAKSPKAKSPKSKTPKKKTPKAKTPKKNQ